MEGEAIIIGYYPFRAKGQIPRLLCEYLHLPYRDRFFTPDEWNKFKQVEGRNWVVKDLPFLKHEGFKLTGNFAMAEYLCELGGRGDMLGKTLQHRLRFDYWRNRIHLKEKLMSKMCSLRPMSREEKKACMGEFFRAKILPMLVQHESECQADNFYFGYVTVMDFVMYQLVNLMSVIFPEVLPQFIKLKSLRDRVAELPEIKEYEVSPRAVTSHCPIAFFQKFKEQKLKACQEMLCGGRGGGGCGGSGGNGSGMDLE